MKLLLVSVLPLTLIACGPSEPPDPNAPRYKMQWVPFNTETYTDPELAELICKPRADAAEYAAEQAAEKEYSDVKTTCTKDYLGNAVCNSERVSRGGFATGFNISAQGNRAYKTVFNGCMAEYGLVYKSICTKNCPSE